MAGRILPDSDFDATRFDPLHAGEHGEPQRARRDVAAAPLAVDRDGFSAAVTARLEGHPLITIAREEVTGLPPEEWDQAIIATADFFTPVVDDPYQWGRIAAANALSDVYAMGGVPIVGVNLLGWPREKLPFELAAEVLRGGGEICAEAGAYLAGGHSIDDPEPKYGLAVTGLAHPDRLLRNDAGRAGVPLTLTKPLGLGILNTSPAFQTVDYKELLVRWLANTPLRSSTRPATASEIPPPWLPPSVRTTTQLWRRSGRGERRSRGVPPTPAGGVGGANRPQ